MPGNITVLRPVDRIALDSGPLAAMRRDIGPVGAEQVVARATGELALTIAGLTCRVRAREMEDLHRPLRRLQRLAENMGMVSLGQVSADLRACLDGGDATAFAAVWARLVRVAEGSLAGDGGLLGQRG